MLVLVFFSVILSAMCLLLPKKEKCTLQQTWCVPNTTLTLHIATGKMFCGLMKIKLNLSRCLSAELSFSCHLSLQLPCVVCVVVESLISCLQDKYPDVHSLHVDHDLDASSLTTRVTGELCVCVYVSQVAVTFAVGSEVHLQSSSDFRQMGKPFLMGTVALGKKHLCVFFFPFCL